MNKKNVLLGTLLLFIGLFGYLAYYFYLGPSSNLQSIYLIPKDAVFVVETQEPLQNWDKIRESEVWKHLQKNNYFLELTESIHKMDTIFHQKKKIIELFDTRSLFFSVHMYRPKNYGLFFVLDLKRVAKLKLLNTYLNTLLNDSYSLSKRSYKNHEIIELYDKKSRETLHLSFIKNQLVASYVHALVEASIDQFQEPVIGRSLDFIEVKKETGYSDMFRLYMQHDFLDDYFKYFSNKQNKWVETLSSNFLFSGFHFDLESNNTITAEGYTNISQNNVSFLKVLQRSGKAKRTIPTIVPKRTAFYLSYGFDSFKEFYKNFEEIQEEKVIEFESYQDNIEKVEKYLKINVAENILSWVDNEIALLQIQSSITHGKNEMALVIKANDINKARTNLDVILKQIKKRTPVKFKQVTYKEHTINFLSIKGFFKLFLGTTFNEFDKPYFTIIDNYVVFSNQPNTLKSIIDDYLKENTLSTSEDFKHFNRYFDIKSSVFAYINTPVLYNNMLSLADKYTQQQMLKNKDFIVCFPQIGFQLLPSSTMFESKLVVSYQDAELVKSKEQFKDIQLAGPSIPYNNTNDNIIKVKDVFDIPRLYPNDLNAKEYIKKYKRGAIHFKVALKDGQKHGNFYEYYLNGAIKIKGRYRKDKQVGLWKAYNEKGDLIKRKRF